MAGSTATRNEDEGGSTGNMSQSEESDASLEDPPEPPAKRQRTVSPSLSPVDDPYVPVVQSPSPPNMEQNLPSTMSTVDLQLEQPFAPATDDEPELESDDDNPERGQPQGDGYNSDSSDEDEGLLDDEGSIAPSGIEHVERANEFIRDIREATLDNDNLSEDVIHRLRNPGPRDTSQLTSDYRLAIDIFTSTCKQPEHVYTDVAAAINRASERIQGKLPEDAEPVIPAIPSLYLMRKEIEEITGVVAVEDDMCIDSCAAFTGPFRDEKECSFCGKPRWLPNTRTPVQVASTFPLGPQLQAIRQSKSGAEALRYRHNKTVEILKRMNLVSPDGSPVDFEYDDIFCGEDYLEMHDSLGLTEDDVLVGFAVDGAQLYDSTESDTQIGVWIIQEYNPKTRFKRKYVLPALIVPGPHKPKNMDSFTYRSFHHLSALQRENAGRGMKVWDAVKEAVVYSQVIFHLGTADAIGLVDLDGRVGHHGAQGCRLGCPMKGRHKPGSGHYYAVHLRPINYTVKSCDHPDVDIRAIPATGDIALYRENLEKVQNASPTEYVKQRKRTGISKPSILSGLVERYMLPPPKCFTIDLMHLIFLNVGELLIPLWRGTMKAGHGDDASTWPWATLVDQENGEQVWTNHGALVAAATKYFPSSFHRTPRNPAEKINSGFKATEYYLYLFALGPAFFRTVLPPVYWKHFCRLVHGVHIVLQRNVSQAQLLAAHQSLALFVEEFELLYYQRKVSRIHFCRPWIHTLLHIVPEIMRLGPAGYYSQWTTERAIGYLGQLIRQPSNPHRNLAKIAERECQLNALHSIYPEFDPPKPPPRASQDCGNGYVLHPPRSRSVDYVAGPVGALLESTYGPGASVLRCWGKLTLPNGQKVRSLYSERRGTRKNSRVTRNAKIILDGEVRYAEVQLYFEHDRETKAIVSVYSRQIQELYNDSYGTLYACTYSGAADLRIIPISDITSLVSMQPMPRLPSDPPNLWFPAEKSGLDDMDLDAHPDDQDDEDDDED